MPARSVGDRSRSCTGSAHRRTLRSARVGAERSRPALASAASSAVAARPSRQSRPSRPRVPAPLSASWASEITTAPTSASARPITATTTCHAGRLRRSSRRSDPDQDPDDRVRDRHGRHGRRQAPGAERDLLQDEAAGAGDRERVALPVREHRADALVQVVERRLREGRRKAEHHPCDGSVDGGLLRQPAAAAEHEQQGARAPRAGRS